MALVKNGVLTIPLYHGTTELFIDSIKESGLGNVDPLVGLKAKEFMHDLFEVAEKQGWKDEEWLNCKKSILPIVQQQKIEDVQNFSHGESYLTYFPELAVKYAVENPFGCEFLTYLRILLGVLASRKVDGLKEMFIDRPVLKLWEKPHDPYVVTVNNVKLEDIETETGKDVVIQLQEIENLKENGIIGPQSFKLRSQINREDLTVTRLGRWDLENGNLIKEKGEFSELI